MKRVLDRELLCLTTKSSPPELWHRASRLRRCRSLSPFLRCVPSLEAEKFEIMMKCLRSPLPPSLLKTSGYASYRYGKRCELRSARGAYFIFLDQLNSLVAKLPEPAILTRISNHFQSLGFKLQTKAEVILLTISGQNHEA